MSAAEQKDEQTHIKDRLDNAERDVDHLGTRHDDLSDKHYTLRKEMHEGFTRASDERGKMAVRIGRIEKTLYGAVGVATLQMLGVPVGDLASSAASAAVIFIGGLW